MNNSYFYQNDKIATLKKAESTHSILRTSNLVLAENEIDTKQNTGLLKTDANSSVLAVCRADAEQAISYSAYGETPHLASINTSLGFNGERYQPQPNAYLLDNGYRAYSTSLMRFHSPDSLSPFESGGINAYAYCSADPINNSDPTGHMPLPIRKVTPPPSYWVATLPTYDSLFSAPRLSISSMSARPSAPPLSPRSSVSYEPSAPPLSPRPSVSFEPTAPTLENIASTSQTRLATPPTYSRFLERGHTSSTPTNVRLYDLSGEYIKKLQRDISAARTLENRYQPNTIGRSKMKKEIKKLTNTLDKEMKINQKLKETPEVIAYLVRQAS